MRLGLDVDVAPGAAALDDRPATDRVHEHAAHQRQVDDDAAVDAREAGNRMPAAANRDFELLAAGEPQCRRHVGRPGALDDHSGMLVVGSVPESTRVVVARIARADDVPAKLSRELGDGGVTEYAGVVRSCSHGKTSDW